MVSFKHSGSSFLFFNEQNGIETSLEEWQNSDRRSFKILQCLADNDYAEICGNAIKVPYKNIYQLDETEAARIGLPAFYPFDVYIQGQNSLPRPDFAYSYSFYDFAPDGNPFILAKKEGSVISLKFYDGGEQDYILSKEQHELLQAIDEFNALPSAEKNLDGNYRKFAEIKKLSQKASSVLESFFANKEVILPEHIKIHIEYDDAKGEMEIIPQISKEDSDLNKKFLNVFDKANSIRDIYPVSVADGKKIQVLIPPRQKETLRRIKQKYRRTTDKEAIKQIVDNPASVLGIDDLPPLPENSEENIAPEETLSIDEIDLSEFYSDRVIELGIYHPTFYPFLSPYRSEWLPSYNIDGRGGTVNISFNTIEELNAFKKDIEKAKAEGKKTIDYKGDLVSVATAELIAQAAEAKFKEMPANQTPKAESKPKDDENKEKPAEDSSANSDKEPEKVLIIKQNIKDLEYSKYAEKENALSKLAFYKDDYLYSDFVLKKHQMHGIAWLQSLNNGKEKGALLADDMGLGKTLQILYFIDWHYRNSQVKKPYIVVAPVSLLENWQKEYERFFAAPRLPVRIARSIDKDFNRAIQNEFSEPQLLLASYETVRMAQLNFCTVDFAVAVLDEAQKVKTPGTLATNAVKALKADFKVAMTGTPIENSFVDLWCIMDFAVPGLLGSAKKFALEYQTKRPKENVEEWEQTVKEKGEKLRSEIDLYFLRRLKDNIASELPKKKIEIKTLEIPLDQRAIYKQAVIAGAAKNEKDNNAMLSVINSLKIISDHPYIYLKNWEQCSDEDIINASAKLQLTIKILQEIQERNEKAIIFAERKETQKLLQYIISNYFGLDVRIINGETKSIATGRNKMSRQGIIDDFENTDGFNVIVMSQLSCGVGLNITAANNVIHYSRHWNPAKEQQATDRAYRIGQTKDVNVYYPMAILPPGGGDSFDIVLDKLLKAKTSLSQSALYPSDQMEVSVKDVYGSLFGQAKEPTEPKQTEHTETVSSLLTMEYVDSLNEYMFEALVAEIYRRQGYDVLLTPKSGDKGIDVLAEKDTECLAIQCKHTKKQADIDAIREAHSGAAHYSKLYSKHYLPCAVANSEFTTGAKELSASTNTRIIDREKLSSMLGNISESYIIAMESRRMEKL